jgi:hypothetical protein
LDEVLLPQKSNKYIDVLLGDEAEDSSTEEIDNEEGVSRSRSGGSYSISRLGGSATRASNSSR